MKVLPPPTVPILHELAMTTELLKHLLDEQEASILTQQVRGGEA